MDLSALLARRPAIWWSSPTTTLAGFGELRRMDTGRGPGRFEAARQQTSGVEIAFASFSFGDEGDSSVLAAETTVELTGEDIHWYGRELDWSEASPPLPARTDRPRFAGSSLPDHLWLEAVAKAITAIESGDLEKVVLARDHALWSKEPFDPHVILSRLHSRFAGCYLFLIDGLVGASPELLIRRNGTNLESVTLAGTVGRGADEAEDTELGRKLMTSEKTRLEHRLAADEVGARLQEISSDLRFSANPELLVLANVQHLATRFQGNLDRPTHILDVADRLHPTPAVGGVSTKAALAMIAELEGMVRGRYAGPVGYFRQSGDGEFAIALRCAELSGARARLFAGNGIVTGSIPEEELEETRLKLRAMLSALE